MTSKSSTEAGTARCTAQAAAQTTPVKGAAEVAVLSEQQSMQRSMQQETRTSIQHFLEEQRLLGSGALSARCTTATGLAGSIAAAAGRFGSICKRSGARSES